MSKEKIIYVYPSKSTFISRDIEMLGEEYTVIENFFSVRSKKLVPLEFLKQFFFLISKLRKSKGVICHFAGYSSYLPSLISRLYKKPCLIIVAGTDASKFQDFNYGNFTRKLFGYFTGTSLKNATHILPVHESLYYQDYSYYDGGKPAQGYSYFYPKAKNVPFTPVYYAYKPEIFKITGEKERTNKSFVTIGNLADKYCFKRKGYDLILELAELRPDCEFTIVGSPSGHDMTVPSNVTVLPFKNQEEIIQIFNEHQFYFQLSIMEGFPNALAEAMLCGCIPIGSNVSGIPYIIQDKGFILQHRNLDELNQIIDQALSLTEHEAKTLSYNSRKRIAEEFTIENRKNKLIEILNLKK